MVIRGGGRGGMMRPSMMGRPPRPPPPPFAVRPFVPKLSFDIFLCENAFPRVKPPNEEAAFTQVRNKIRTIIFEVWFDLCKI